MKNFLKESEIKYLVTRHRRERDRKVADRIKAVLLSNNEFSNEEIADILLLDEDTIHRHIKEYKKNNKLNLVSGGSESLLSSKQREELKKHLEENTYTKAEAICFYVKQKYGINYTVSGITAWLKSNRFSYKKPKGTPAKANKEKQAEFKKYYKDLKKNTPSDEPILFMDAVHPTMATKLSYGWIKKGFDKKIATTASRTRVNLLGSINIKTMNLVIDNHKTINSEAVIKHFQDLHVSYSKASKIHVILDRGPYNCSKETIKAAKEHNIVLHHLPPYSPNLNPIERLWKIMNEFVRNNYFFAQAKQFREAIDNFFNEIWPTISLSMASRINDNFQTV
jgi:transposase